MVKVKNMQWWHRLRRMLLMMTDETSETLLRVPDSREASQILKKIPETGARAKDIAYALRRCVDPVTEKKVECYEDDVLEVCRLYPKRWRVDGDTVYPVKEHG